MISTSQAPHAVTALSASHVRHRNPFVEMVRDIDFAPDPALRVRRMAEADMPDLWRLRYECYHAAGYIPANGTGMFRDEYDELPNVRSYGLFDATGLIASLRTLDYRQGSKGYTQTSALRVHPEATRYERFIEVNRLVYRNGHVARHAKFGDVPSVGLKPIHAFRLFRAITFEAVRAEAPFVFVSVRERQKRFYKRTMLLKEIGAPAQYHGVTFQSTPMVHDMHADYRAACLKNPSLAMSDTLIAQDWPEL